VAKQSDQTKIMVSFQIHRQSLPLCPY
jgi:hypothetical protein